ncbi:hypothetical protein Tco_1252436 [Tanacetum coccineum]
MTESEPNKKSKKEIEQEKLSFAEAIRLQEQMDEEQRAQIARDEEIARQWDEEKGKELYGDTQKGNERRVKESGAKRKKSLPRKRRTVKRQKLEEDAEKEELKGFLDIIPREDVAEMMVSSTISASTYLVLPELVNTARRKINLLMVKCWKTGIRIDGDK